MRKPVIVVIVFVVILIYSIVYAQDTLPIGCQVTSRAGNDPEYPADQITLVCVPPKWNNKLIVYAHGYTPIQEPLSLPLDDLVLADGKNLAGIFMSRGYAFATSSYHKNGYAVEQASEDLNNLVNYFITVVPKVGTLKATYIVGMSEGGLIATILLEQYPATYRAGLAFCGPIGGTPYELQYLGDFRAVFDYYFPGIFGFGAVDVPPDAFQDWQAYAQDIASSLKTSPFTDELFKVTGAARDIKDPTTAVETALGVLFFNIWGTNDLIDVASGQSYNNLSTLYKGSKNNFNLNRNIERVKSDQSAADYMKRYYTPSGNLTRPLVTMHTTLDGSVPFQHELMYLQAVTLAGRREKLTILPVYRYGHCNFTEGEMIKAIDLMLSKAEKQ